ncbi:LOW QUALITY PROTEIN: penicillin-binding protein 3 [Bacillus sp. JCM 19046]|nr:LOW QUALITY PROTEIN: penicillin-binding protein 3 [Bacillus sp. JCM 19046]
MKRKQLSISLIACGLLVLSACSNDESPEAAITTFIEHWENRAYDQMYAMLTDDVQASFSEEAFIERYENIYNSLVPEFTIDPSLPEEWSEEGYEDIPIAISMETIAGAYSFEEQLRVVQPSEDEEEWRVQWGSHLIFPDLGDEDSVRVNRTDPVRGEIFSADGQGLAINGTVVTLAVVRDRFEDMESEISSIAAAFDMTEDSIRSQLEQGWVEDSSFVPIGQKPESELGFIESVMDDVPGFTYRMDGGRVYPFAENAAHLIGYVRPITAEQLEDRTDQVITAILFGRAGESAQEELLRGTPGVKIHLENADGDDKATIVEQETVNGEDLHLTIDIDLQQEITNQFAGEKGTAVALDPLTGATLALVSSPSYDPNSVTLGLSASQRAEIEEDENQPMLNRFYSLYSPGSTFKAMTAAIGLEEGTLSPEDSIEVNGLEWQPENADWGNYSVRRVTDPGGPVDLTAALVYSDNIYFAQEALELGEEAMTEGAAAFGFSETVPYLYPFRQSLLTGEDGFNSEIQLADSGYGQGQILINPVHLASMYTTFLNEGELILPVLGKEEETGVTWKTPMSAETATIIDDALEQVVSSPNGTASSMQIDGLSLAAKTGTAEVGSSEDGTVLGWVVSYDRDNPELLLAMMQEDVGSGEVVPKVKELYQYMNR